MKLIQWIWKGRGRREADDLAAFGAALVSLTTQIPRPDERRADPRILAMLPIARIERKGSDIACRIRNISAGGLMAEVSTLPDADEAVTVELDSGRRIPGAVAWIRDHNIGIRFDENVDIRTIFAVEKPRIGFRPRPPRMEMRCSATVRIDGIYHQVEVRDISVGGMKVALRCEKAIGKVAVVTVEHLPPVRGEIRWSEDGMIGIAFDAMLSFDELVSWLGKRIEIASRMGSVQRP
ncbi:PilZ domain-containing protein [Allosphingosinicella flava]|uniref:PilZ domain-containing protein n=1 Tax=Allosphingosinicella flava TaxID=2771430 RepID=A0A7T2LN79_9SPHN|nr:PilZ domain-containing protein [Sphingosinicella flava]QPQ56093.1 PilZ domain-containing protein [Sphingosinicella flava]